MTTFFDTSAVVPILIEERFSKIARETWASHNGAYAWRWLMVETETALVRRSVGAFEWREWRGLRHRIKFLSLPEAEFPELCDFNRSLGLRSADAGHLFVFQRLLENIPDLHLMTFDVEMAAAARKLALPLHPSVPG